MPLLRFRPLSGSCKLCHGELELALASSEPTPQECPKCGQAIGSIPNQLAPHAKINRKPSNSEVKEAGFKVLKRISEGEYEEQ